MFGNIALRQQLFYTILICLWSILLYNKSIIQLVKKIKCVRLEIKKNKEALTKRLNKYKGND